MSSIIRPRNGVIVCSFAIDDGNIPPTANDTFSSDTFSRAHAIRPQLPYGAAVPFNSRNHTDFRHSTLFETGSHAFDRW